MSVRKSLPIVPIPKHVELERKRIVPRDEPIGRVHKFIFDNWKIIKKLWWGGPSADTIIYIRDDYWSCFFVPMFFSDVYGGYKESSYFRKPMPTTISQDLHLVATQESQTDHSKLFDLVQDTNNFKKILDIETLHCILQPGYVYDFGIFGHNFTIIYNNPKELYYSDYYEETHRPNVFRLEQMSYETIISYLESYICGDLSLHKGFHQADDDYFSTYVQEFRNVPHESYKTLEYHRTRIVRQPIIADVLQTIRDTRPSDEQVEESLEYEDFNLAEWKEMYKNLSDELLNLSLQYK